MEFRQVLSQGLQKHVPAEEENAAVPVVATLPEKGAGPGEIRLFRKSQGLEAPGRQGFSGLDVAIAGVGAGGGDAEGHQEAGPGLGGAKRPGRMRRGWV